MREAPDLRVGTWLAVGFGAAAALLLAAGGAALLLLARLERAERTQADVVAPRAAAAQRLERDVLGIAIAVRAYALTPGTGRRADAEAAIGAARESLRGLAGIPKSSEGAAPFARVEPAVRAYCDAAAGFLDLAEIRAPAAEAGPAVAARREAELSLRARREAALAPLRAFAAHQEKLSRQATAEVLALQAATHRTLVRVGVVALALLGASALLVARMVRRPAVALAAAARRVAEGDYAAGAEWAASGPPRRNELAELQRAFGRMAADLREREERIVAQNEELQAQQEELQAQNEELQSQQEELQAQHEELHSQAEQLRAHEESLEEADRRKDEFIAVLSHELRNPLAPIVSGLHLLERADPASETARKARGVMRRQVTHLTRLVEDLLDVTRIRRGKVHLRRSRVDLVALVRHAVEDHASTLSARKLALGMRLPAAELWVDADPARIAQITGNLLHNAAKFTPAGGRVEVALEARDGARAVLRVRDTGVGISPEVLPRLFQPFTQAERSLARTDGGLGLGLALVKGLVELHGGTVRAASDGEGLGAELTVELPLAGGAAARPVDGASRASSRRRRVLVVEDNVDAADSLAEVLRLAGHDVAVAADGAAGIRAAIDSGPEVVLCDLGLPGLDGFEVARRLRAERRLDATLLVALTGYALAEDVRRAREAGFDAHLTKPASADDLDAVLRRERAPLYASRDAG